MSDAIKITPEMIEAGLTELWTHPITEPTEAEMREAVASVFRAMIAARECVPGGTELVQSGTDDEQTGR